MKLRDVEELKTKEAASFEPYEEVRVYQTIELVELDDKQVEQSTFVLASSLEQALKIVGKDERRKMIYVRELCPISRLPTDIYRPRYVNPVTKKDSDSSCHESET